MNQSVNVIWEKCLNAIKNEITALSFSTWFVDLKPVDMINNQFRIAIPENMAFNRSILENRYLLLISNALSEVIGERITAEFILENEINNSDTIKVKDASPIVQESVNESKQTLSEGNHTTGNLNPKYNFDLFVIGENNRFAHAASVAVAEFPSERYNPLFIYGGVGLGKTHLMQAIGNYINEYMPSKKVVYVSCENFTNGFIDAIRTQNSESFRNKYRNVDVLLVDDIQFLAGKEGTQEEFFHTFNALHEMNKQIVITSDRPPREIPNLAERLRSRFEMGLTTDISTPNFETRIAILRKKAESNSENISDEVLSYIADNIHSNIRELEGALTTAIAYANLNGIAVNLENTKKALKEFFSKENKVIDASYIKDITAKFFNITVEEMDSKSRKKNISQPRQVAMYLIRELTDLSLPKIGEAFGGRDHTTVLHGYLKVKEEMENNNDFSNLVIRISKEITG